MTRSPGVQPVTPSPSAAISPANSPPARAGSPERISAPRISSPRLVPAARTATRTWPAPAAGTGVSRSSNTAPLGPGTVNHAFIVCAIARVSFAGWATRGFPRGGASRRWWRAPARGCRRRCRARCRRRSRTRASGTPASRPLATTWPFICSISVRRRLVTSWPIDDRQLRLDPRAGVTFLSSSA